MWCDQNAGCRRANVAIVLKNKWNTRPVGWFVNKFVVVGEFERKCRMLLLLFSAGERVSVWWRNIVRFVRRSLHVQCAQTITLYWTAAAAYSWHVFQSGDEERGVRLFPPLRPLLGPSGDGGKGSIRGGGVWEFRRRRERERESSWTNQKKAPRYFSLSSIRPLLFSFLGGEDFRNDETTSKNRREKADEYCRQPLQEMS